MTASAMVSGMGGSGHAEGTTQAAVSQGSIVIRDQNHQQQDISGLQRDVTKANDTVSPIFDKQKEQDRLQAAQLIGDIGNQVSDIVRTAGDLKGLEAAKKASGKQLKDGATEKERQDWLTSLRNSSAYKKVMETYGTGSDLQRAITAATAAVSGLSGGNLGSALSGAAAPYIANEIGKYITQDNALAGIMAHAVVNAALAKASGQNAAVGAAGAAVGEATGMLLAKEVYGKSDSSQLTDTEKQTISALSTLASGLAGGLTGGSSLSATQGAQAGKTTVENNWLSVSEKSELEIAKQKLRSSRDPAEREQAEKDVARLTELDISRDKKVIAACGNGNAASAGCATTRLEAYQAKVEYENTGNYNSRASQQYADAYGQIVNLLNITSVDAQNQQQIRDAVINFFMETKGVDYETAKGYAELKEGAEIIIASTIPVLGEEGAKQLSKIFDSNLKVVARGNVDGVEFSDTNQGARPSALADANKPTLIDGRVQVKIDKQNKALPNGNMATAHAEVGVIQQAFEKGMTQGREMTMSVSKEPVCGFCRGDVAAMADKAGLKSLTIYEEATGSVLYWQPGMKSLKARD